MGQPRFKVYKNQADKWQLFNQDTGNFEEPTYGSRSEAQAELDRRRAGYHGSQGFVL